MNTPNKFGHVTTTGILTPEAKSMMEKQGFKFVASEKSEAGAMIHHFMTPKVISMTKQEILQGGFGDSCGTMGRVTDIENPTSSSDVVGKIKSVLQQMATRESQKERFKKTFSLRPNMFSGTARDFMQFGIDPQTPGAISGRFKDIEED
jgi:hypothetical protein